METHIIPYSTSRNILAVGYNQETEMSLIWFRSGWIYQYLNVSPVMMRNFLAPKAKFDFIFTRFIRNGPNLRAGRYYTLSDKESFSGVLAESVNSYLENIFTYAAIFFDTNEDNFICLKTKDLPSAGSKEIGPIISLYVEGKSRMLPEEKIIYKNICNAKEKAKEILSQHNLKLVESIKTQELFVVGLYEE